MRMEPTRCAVLNINYEPRQCDCGRTASAIGAQPSILSTPSIAFYRVITRSWSTSRGTLPQTASALRGAPSRARTSPAPPQRHMPTACDSVRASSASLVNRRSAHCNGVECRAFAVRYLEGPILCDADIARGNARHRPLLVVQHLCVCARAARSGAAQPRCSAARQRLRCSSVRCDSVRGSASDAAKPG